MDNPTRILVVDDEPDLELLIRQRFRHKIRANEIHFEFASNGVEALQMMCDFTQEYDMVLTDINMPEMDGLTLLIRIKEQFEHQKAVVVSAYGDMENIRTAMNRGAFDFITKPIDFGDLETTIVKAVREVNIIREGQKARRQLDQTLLEKEIAEIERKKAEQSERFKQQFLANMSHEIRTPMNSVIGLTNLLFKTSLDPQQLKYMNVIKKASENLLVIINDVLDLSKIEAGKMEFEHISFVLEESIETVYNTLLFKAQEKELDFQVDIDPQVPKVLYGDPVRLNQILINLGGNAVKFTTKGCVTLKAQEISRDGSESLIEFSVIDTGIGIPEESLKKVFESFSQASTETTRMYGGTGLGLTISKQLIELQKGSIRVDSKTGIGTTFSFRIPYEIGKADDIGKHRSSATDINPELLRGIRILLVEDNSFNQMVAIDTLNDLLKEITIDLAEDGKSAVEKVNSGDYDIILMDIQMPVMDGFEACKIIRQELPAPKRKIPIMAMTANVTKDEVQSCFDSGMDDYIAKPFDPQVLLNKLGNLVLKKK